MRIFNSRWLRVSAVAPPHRAGVFGQALPYNERLESIADRHNCWRLSASESDRALARRTMVAICEAIERKHQDIKSLERDLDIVLAIEKG